MDDRKPLLPSAAAILGIILIVYAVIAGKPIQSIDIGGFLSVVFGNPTPSQSVTPTPSQEITPHPPQPVTPPSPVKPAVGGSSTDNSSSNTGESSACTVMIANSLVSLMKDPDYFSQQLVRVQPGQYPVLDSKTISFAGRDQGWYQIEANGRRGWIADDTWTISSKSRVCQ